MPDTRALLVIIGITGNQGGSVATTFLADPTLSTQYRLRGLTRNPLSPASLALSAQGVEMIRADLHSPPSALAPAFADAHTIFHVTDFWKPYFAPHNQERARERGIPIGELAYQLELEQGINVARAVAAVAMPSLRRFVVSTTCSPRVQTGGKYHRIWHFDAKGDFVAWVKRELPGLAKRMSCLNMGVFVAAWRFGTITAPNLVEGKGEGEGGGKEWVLRMPCDSERKLPFVDPKIDTGCFVRALVGVEPGVSVLGECEMLSWGEWVEMWRRVLEKKVRFERCSVEFYEKWFLEKGYPEGCGTELGEMFEFMGDWGYDGGDPECKTKEDLGMEVMGLSSVEKYIRNEDWSPVGA